MSEPDLPDGMLAGLRQLQVYCQDYFSDRFAREDVVLAFWEIPDDDLFFEVLGFFPLFCPPVPFSDTLIPEGFRIAYPIFALEDDYHFNGWTALRNKRELLPDAVLAYMRMDMPEEAAALRAAIDAHDAGFQDSELGDAYSAVRNPYREDEARWVAQANFFCANRKLFQPLLRETD